MLPGCPDTKVDQYKLEVDVRVRNETYLVRLCGDAHLGQRM
jgi:hypothetical protein